MGYLFRLNNANIHWKSTQTALTCQSSTEAELQAVTAATNEASWLNELLIFIGLVKERLPYLLKVDNTSAIKKVINGNFSSKSKHYAVRLNVALDRYQGNEFTIEHVPSSLQLADILTKPVTTLIMSNICDLVFEPRNTV